MSNREIERGENFSGLSKPVPLNFLNFSLTSQKCWFEVYLEQSICLGCTKFRFNTSTYTNIFKLNKHLEEKQLPSPFPALFVHLKEGDFFRVFAFPISLIRL